MATLPFESCALFRWADLARVDGDLVQRCHAKSRIASPQTLVADSLVWDLEGRSVEIPLDM